MVCAHNPVNCPSVICLPRMAILSSFGRETSLVNIIGPRSIFPILFTPTINLLLYFLFCCYHYHYYAMRFILCKQQGRRDWQPLCTRWEAKLFVSCVGPGEVNNLELWMTPLFTSPPTYHCRSPMGSILNLGVFTKGNLSAVLHLTFHLGFTNEGREINIITSHIGDLHTETNNFAPNEYRGVVNSSGLAVYKGSKKEIIVQLKVRTESKLKV